MQPSKKYEGGLALVNGAELEFALKAFEKNRADFEKDDQLKDMFEKLNEEMSQEAKNLDSRAKMYGEGVKRSGRLYDYEVEIGKLIMGALYLAECEPEMALEASEMIKGYNAAEQK